MTFDQLNLIAPLLQALNQEGYTSPTPIQAQAIPMVLEGRDILGCAQTGTGKTAAFALPVLQLLHETRSMGGKFRPVRALVLTPTRELAVQVSESFTAYGRHTGLKNVVIFGGVSQNPQVDAIRRGVDVVVATPGRLLDLIDQGHLKLRDIQFFVLDEADRMLDMGFAPDVKRIIAMLPLERRSLLFSATMPKEILRIADQLLQNPAKVEVTPVASTAEKVEQQLYFIEKSNKRKLLVELLKDEKIESSLIFTRTKHGADRVARELGRAGVKAEAIHGDKSQNARQRSLNAFKARKLRVLVATDIASRGIDIDDLSHVINYEIPNEPETYVHRIGRTGRAGALGVAISFCDSEERSYIRDIQKLIGKKIPVIETPVLPHGKTDMRDPEKTDFAPSGQEEEGTSYDKPRKERFSGQQPHPKRKPFGKFNGHKNGGGQRRDGFAQPNPEQQSFNGNGNGNSNGNGNRHPQREKKTFGKPFGTAARQHKKVSAQTENGNQNGFNNTHSENQNGNTAGNGNGGHYSHYNNGNGSGQYGQQPVSTRPNKKKKFGAFKKKKRNTSSGSGWSGGVSW